MWRNVPFPGTIMTGADLQLWKQYSLTLPCSTLHWENPKSRIKTKITIKKNSSQIYSNLLTKPRPRVPIMTAAGFNISASLQITLPASPSTTRATLFTYNITTNHQMDRLSRPELFQEITRLSYTTVAYHFSILSSNLSNQRNSFLLQNIIKRRRRYENTMATWKASTASFSISAWLVSYTTSFLTPT